MFGIVYLIAHLARRTHEGGEMRRLLWRSSRTDTQEGLDAEEFARRKNDLES